MLPETLTALACLIANKGPLDSTSLENQLSNTDKAQAQAIIDSGACLPEKMEKLLQDTHDKIAKGELMDAGGQSKPTGGCD